MSKIQILKRALQREREAKEIAEKFIEERIYNLYSENVSLNKKYLVQADFLLNLINNFSDALLVIDLNGNIIQSNNEARNLLGLERKEKMPLHIDEFDRRTLKFFKNKIKSAETRVELVKKERLSFVNRKKQKKIIVLISNLLKNFNGKTHAIQMTIRDLTEQIELDRMLQRRYDEQKYESYILKDLLKVNNLFDIAQTLVIHLAQYLKTDDCVFYSVVNGKLVQIAATGNKIETDTKSIKNRLVLPVNKGIVGQAAREKKGRIINDTSKSKNYIADDLIRLSEITIPLLLDDEVIGVIDSEHPEKNHYHQFQLDFLYKISATIAFKLKAATNELEKQLKADELLRTKNRFELVFNGHHNAKVIESVDGFILDIGERFFNLFGIPVSQKSSMIGISCLDARKLFKEFFKDEEDFDKKTEKLLSDKKLETNQILELKDGRFFSRDFTPVLLNGNIDCYVWTYRDVTSDVNYEKNVNFEKEKYKYIIDNMNLGLLEVSNEDDILSINKSFCAMSGYLEDELLGKKAKDLLLNPDSELNGYFRQQRQFSKLDYTKSYELEILHKNGEVRNWLVSGNSLKSKGIDIGSVWVNLDITDYKKLINKNEDLIKNLTDRNEELSRYAHLVSHDLKTPLRTISTFLHWIYDDNKDVLANESLEHINTIEDTVLDMEKLITSTLQFAEIGSSKTNSQVDLLELISKMIENNFSHFSNEIIINLPKTFPVINFNEVQVRQIFQNIIDNSYKYRDVNKKSFISIEWKDNDDHYLFKIEDNGIGIDKSNHHMVFEIFKKMSARTDSSGVGLWIVKKMIENAGGEIWFDSELGVGTTFYFTIKK